MAEIILTSENFEKEAVNSALPILIDFYAEWCGPCKMIAPYIEEISREYEGKIKVCKVDIDSEPSLADSFGITSIPTLAVLKNGELTQFAVGYRTKDEIIKLL